MNNPLSFSFLLLMLFLSACASPASSSVARVTPLQADYDAPLVDDAPPADDASPTASSTVVQLALKESLLATATPIKEVATSTPLSVALDEGEAAAIARATDVALEPTPRNELTFASQPVPIAFDEFYDGYNLRSGLILSDKLVSLDGQQVVMEGYIAPPLQPELDYFVLTKIQLEFCPFCSTAADWPDDIALIYVSNPIAVTQRPIRLTGELHVGTSVDQETGMVSLVRIYADEVEVLE